MLLPPIELLSVAENQRSEASSLFTLHAVVWWYRNTPETDKFLENVSLEYNKFASGKMFWQNLIFAAHRRNNNFVTFLDSEFCREWNQSVALCGITSWKINSDLIVTVRHVNHSKFTWFAAQQWPDFVAISLCAFRWLDSKQRFFSSPFPYLKRLLI